MNTREPAVAPVPVIRAVVHSGDSETTYLRSGSGSALVLVAAELDQRDVLEMMTALSRDFLVLLAAPALPDAASLSRWLREFLECLGVADAHVVLHRSVATILSGDSINA
jgi:hypothetical protein